MKRRSTINKYKQFLDHLDSNNFNKNKIEIIYLKNVQTFKPYFEEIVIDLMNEGLIKRKKNTYHLTVKGFDYLEKIKTREFKIEQYTINKTIMVATIILAASSILEIETVFIQGSQVLINLFRLFLIVLILVCTGWLIYQFLFK